MRYTLRSRSITSLEREIGWRCAQLEPPLAAHRLFRPADTHHLKHRAAAEGGAVVTGDGLEQRMGYINEDSGYMSGPSMVRGRARSRWRRWIYAAATLHAIAIVAGMTYLISR